MDWVLVNRVLLPLSYDFDELDYRTLVELAMIFTTGC